MLYLILVLTDRLLFIRVRIAAAANHI